MACDGRYTADEPVFKRYAYTALMSRFPDQAGFEHFYDSLAVPSIKDEFLRLTSFYLFLVKQGDWHVTVEGSAPLVDYLSNSFKVLALFALIESLSDRQHQDFYEWLSERDIATTFPIPDRPSLARLNEEYKATYGSIRRCVAFFTNLPPQRQQALCHAFSVDGKPLPSIKRVAEFLYDLRSKFAHEARLVLQLGNAIALSMKGHRVVETQLSIDALLEVFEEGVLAYFRRGMSCRCCANGLPVSREKVCPICGHRFQGHGWDGIDAHWRSKHESVAPYREFWESLCEKHRS